MRVFKKRQGAAIFGIVSPLVVIALIALSPALTFLISLFAYDWVQLSNVGQSYGVVATMLSGAALLGVLLTVWLQRRQTALLSEQAVRQLHFNVIQEAWQDPTLLQAIETVPAGKVELARQSVYTNFYFMYFRMGYRAGNLTVEEIEDLAAHCFSTPAGQYYWERSEAHMTRHYEKEFVGALARGYARAQCSREGFFLEPLDESQPTPPDPRGANPV